MVEAEAGLGRVRTDEPAAPATLGFSLRLPAILVVLAAGLILRLLLATFPGFGVDVGTFAAWSYSLADAGPWDFYDTDFFTDYAPGYLYVLWFIAEFKDLLQDFGIATLTNKQYEFVLKLPSIAADLASAYLLYRLLEDQRQEARVAAALAYLLLPITWFTGAVWGQVDSLLAFFIMLSVFFLGRGRPLPAALAYTIGFLVKPQAIAALPFLAFWGVRHYPPRVWAEATGVALAVGLVLIFPFFTTKPWQLFDQLEYAASYYKYASFHAYNFWATFAYLEPDRVKFLGISYQIWGYVLYAISTGFVLYSLRRAEGMGALTLGTALCILVFYMFVTRMHERYLFPVFLPLLAACVILNSGWLWTALVGLTILNMLNLYHAYAEFNDNYLRIDWVFNWLQDPNFWGLGLTTVEFLSVLMVITLPPLLAVAYALGDRPKPAHST